jgi:hypothetical protein
VRLCDLRWDPPSNEPASLSEAKGPHTSVHAAELAGADVRMREPEPWLTVVLIAGIIVGTAAAVMGLGALTIHSSGQAPVALGR